MEKVLSVENMYLSEENMIQSGLSSQEMMFNAGKSCFEHIKFLGKKFLIICGEGNNGGDGLVIAYLLMKNFFDVDLFILKNIKSEVALTYYDLCKNLNIKEYYQEDLINFDDYDVIVDAIYGIGFKGNLNDREKNLFLKLQAYQEKIVSIDINSGLNANTGTSEIFIKSNLTLTINNIKPGLLLNNGKNAYHKLKCLNIGIKEINPYYLINKEDIRKILERKNENVNKGDFGYVTLLGGSLSYAGAIKLASLSSIAIASGCGVCQVMVIKPLLEPILNTILEGTVFPLSSENNHIKFIKEEFDMALKNKKAIGIGMGISQNEENIKILRYILLNYNIKVLLDADALNTLSENDNLSLLLKTNCKVVLTPHLKEFSRLIKKDLNDIKENLITYALDFAKKYKVILLLKGPTTIICDGNEVYFVNRGCKGMATAGSGDVLSGIITGLLGYLSPLEATLAGAYINGLAGELAQNEHNEVSMMAHHTIENIVLAIDSILI